MALRKAERLVSPRSQSEDWECILRGLLPLVNPGQGLYLNFKLHGNYQAASFVAGSVLQSSDRPKPALRLCPKSPLQNLITNYFNDHSSLLVVR
ncbi:hypothetical protein [Nostoc sp.]